VENTQIFI